MSSAFQVRIVGAPKSGMGRATKFLFTSLLLSAIWVICLLATSEPFTILLPLWFIVTAASYSCVSIGMKMIVFGDCREAAIQLAKEITMAKMDLRTKGVSVGE